MIGLPLDCCSRMLFVRQAGLCRQQGEPALLQLSLEPVLSDRMKGGKEHRVPLSNRAVSILKEMAELRQSDFVFAGLKQGRSLSDMALLMLVRDLHPGMCGPSKLSAAQVESLRRKLNGSIATRRRRYEGERQLQPSVTRETLKRLRTGARMVTIEIEKIRNLTGYNAILEEGRYAESTDVFLEAVSQRAFGELRDFFDQVYAPLCGIGEAAKIAEREQSAQRNGKHRARQIDEARYIFIEEVAETYHDTYGRRATTTEDGPWCGFLAEVLGRCEQRRITPKSARARWLDVKRKEFRKKLFSSAEPIIRARHVEFWRGVELGRSLYATSGSGGANFARVRIGHRKGRGHLGRAAAGRSKRAEAR